MHISKIRCSHVLSNSRLQQKLIWSFWKVITNTDTPCTSINTRMQCSSKVQDIYICILFLFHCCHKQACEHAIKLTTWGPLRRIIVDCETLWIWSNIICHTIVFRDTNLFGQNEKQHFRGNIIITPKNVICSTTINIRVCNLKLKSQWWEYDSSK